jgi:preprotein translocase subunit SecG
MGVKKTGDFLESTTWVLAILLLSLSLTANIMVSSPSEEEDTSGSPNVETAKEKKGGPSSGPVDTNATKTTEDTTL